MYFPMLRCLSLFHTTDMKGLPPWSTQTRAHTHMRMYVYLCMYIYVCAVSLHTLWIKTRHLITF